ncbi:hypothetical protein GWK47_040003 [Chionoecetes opilio]|uniref:Uncharacterized protein n=1 Tax=Chionoecetes opilio TaxID=41210 RepID=A0A8J4YCF1_CHIOP|nr:hypothetical protein GWK47_040003 [Chionoecetes opilio]
MSEFDLEAFSHDPKVEALTNLRKQDWISVASNYKIPFNPRARKEVIKNVVVEGLVNLEVLPPDAIDALTPCTSSGDQTPKSSLLSQFDLQMTLPEVEKETPAKETLAPREAFIEPRTPQQYKFDYDIQLKRLEMEDRQAQVKFEMEERLAKQKLEMEEKLQDRHFKQQLEMDREVRLREVEIKEVQAKQDLEMKGKELQIHKI